MFLMLPFTISLKIFISMFAFLYVKANSKENSEEISFLKCWRQHFYSSFKAN